MRTTELDLIAKLLLGLMTCMVAALLFILYLLLFDIPPLPPPAPAPERRLCDLSRPDSEPCPPGQLCLHGECLTFDAPPRCHVGEDCRECICAAGLVCDQLVCRSPDELPPAPLECRLNHDLIAAVDALKLKCDQLSSLRHDSLQTGCTGDSWRAISLGDHDFNTLLTNFKHRISIHFEEGAPRPNGSLRDPRQRAHYLRQLQPLRDALRQAKQIFVIGRASPDRNATLNHAIALQRIDTIAALLTEVAHPELPASQRPPLPIQQWAMPEKMKDGTPTLILAEFFADHYVSHDVQRELHVAPYIAWDDAATERLARLLATPTRTSADEAWLLETINRVVLLVLIPCDGSEYVPALDPTIQH